MEIQTEKKNALILKKQDLILLKCSEETKNTDIYGNLFECLKPYKRLSKKDLDNDIVFDSKARMSLNHNIKEIIELIHKEWFARTEFEIAVKETHCQLCGRQNTYICWIKNRINKNELHVGRDCVKHFKDINGIDVAIQKLNTKIRDTTKESRRSDFDSALEENIDFTKNAKERVDLFPVELPYKLYIQIEEAINSCNRIRTSYITSGGELSECIKKFQLKKQEFETLYKKAEEHYRLYKSNRLVCTREISNWLKKSFPLIITDIQKSKGILNEETLKFVYEPNFIKSNLSLFSKCLKDEDVSILNVDGSVIRFKIKNKRFVHPIYFTMDIKSFMKNIGCHCLTQQGYRFSKINISPTIERTSSNMNVVLNYITGVMQKTMYNIVIEEKISQLYWEKKQNLSLSKWARHLEEIKPIYKTTTIENLFIIMSQILFSDDSSENDISKFVACKIEMSGRWITKEEKDRNVQVAYDAAGMQRQKEYVPYI